jgi:hypothetical protein
MACTSIFKSITQLGKTSDGSFNDCTMVQCGGLVLLDIQIMDPVIIIAGLIIAAVEIYIRLL